MGLQAVGGEFWTSPGSDLSDVALSALEEYLTVSVGGVSWGLSDNISVSQVPLPTAAWLFLSALGGLFGVKRLLNSKVDRAMKPALV